MYARRWLDQCHQYHSICGQSLNQSQFYQTRLVEILDEECTNLRLCDTSSGHLKGPYSTLSHCWGGSTVAKLVQDNFEDLKGGFTSDVLPRTFQDAVYVTRAQMKLKYIWIDSLCIIQDSEQDWLTEAASMCRIYRHSFCTIAATRASSGDDGCFVDREAWQVNACCIQSSWNNAENALYEVISAHFQELNVSRTPLNKRAWVVQERLLSPRILHYGRNQLFWECQELFACETYPQGLPGRSDATATNLSILDTAEQRSKSRQELRRCPDSSVRNRWGR